MGVYVLVAVANKSHEIVVYFSRDHHHVIKNRLKFNENFCLSTKQFWSFLIETFSLPTQTNWLKQVKGTPSHIINYSRWRSLLPFMLNSAPPLEFLKLTICCQQKERIKFAREMFRYHVKKFNICPETPSIKLVSGAISSLSSQYYVYSPFVKNTHPINWALDES